MAGEGCLERSPHEVIKYTAGGAVTEGDVIDLTDIVGILLETGVSGDSIAMAISGTWKVPKATHATDQNWIQGEAIFWDDTNKVFTTTATSNTFAGVAAENVVSTAAIGYLILNRGLNAA